MSSYYSTVLRVSLIFKKKSLTWNPNPLRFLNEFGFWKAPRAGSDSRCSDTFSLNILGGRESFILNVRSSYSM